MLLGRLWRCIAVAGISGPWKEATSLVEPLMLLPEQTLTCRAQYLTHFGAVHRASQKVTRECYRGAHMINRSSSASTTRRKSFQLWLDARAKNDCWKSWAETADAIVFGDRQIMSTGQHSSIIRRGIFIESGGKLVDSTGSTIGASICIDDPEGQNRALSLIGSVDWIQATCSDWTMIPAENLVSAAGGSPTRIAVEVREPSQVQGVAFALDLGVDAILVRPDADLLEAAKLAQKQRKAADTDAAASVATRDSISLSLISGIDDNKGIALSSAMVIFARAGGVGDRVCVDLIQSLAAGEGMLVGSSAKLLALVHAETFDTGFVPSRPFRVNAGPVHSYTLLADGTTKYLCELTAGDQVLIVDWEGNSRAVAIGRLKIEARPMTMVQFRSNGDSELVGQIFLQQAETVRLLSPMTAGDQFSVPNGAKLNGSQTQESVGETPTRKSWQPLSVTDIRGGEEILVREVAKGTHVGKEIEASVHEQ